MTYSQQVQNMCPITKGPKHGPAPIPEEGAWVKAYEIKDISILRYSFRACLFILNFIKFLVILVLLWSHIIIYFKFCQYSMVIF